MKKSTPEPMDASNQCCPNETCLARGQIGAGNIRIHSYHPQRYRCWTCQQTFSARKGTMMEGLRADEEPVTRVVTVLSYGCPIQALVHAYGLEERTVPLGNNEQESSVNGFIRPWWNKDRSRVTLSKPMKFEPKKET